MFEVNLIFVEIVLENRLKLKHQNIGFFDPFSNLWNQFLKLCNPFLNVCNHFLNIFDKLKKNNCNKKHEKS